MKKISLVSVVMAAALLGLTGCNNDKALNSRNNLGTNNINNGSNQNLRVSARASNNVESINEVDQAHVILRNNDAYVAVSLKNNNGTTGTGIIGTNDGTAGTRDTTTNNIDRTKLGGRTVGSGDNTNYKKAASPLDKKIERQVRAADRSIDNVYISYDTAFFGQMTNYTNELRNGTNRDGVYNDFTNTINGVFR
ncbi:YhcN/YlaJ family sporulation lipoprotein [Paenibacillus sp. BSR1-1]|uniref:YhcN/YlaJ family sporulation lipoprotein n=1 Tax=Paenibacillus sp. BSR1-1 TaxID=3020845 RepID=UPI0025AFB750|nr:YhcN/YlaJ family sporulation lipoprotein [Paenibacillus sp. BSR1-1]MDN3015455.1 YhcN/YlaJ family sporulation lipoprotein [Paenibacillus sp. BSR1-1]